MLVISRGDEEKIDLLLKNFEMSKKLLESLENLKSHRLSFPRINFINAS